MRRRSAPHENFEMTQTESPPDCLNEQINWGGGKQRLLHGTITLGMLTSTTVTIR